MDCLQQPCPSSDYFSKLSCSHFFSWGNVGGWTAKVWFHLVRVLAKCTQDLKQTDQLCMIDSIDLSRAVLSPKSTTVNCSCTSVICWDWCFRDLFDAGNPVIYIYTFWHRFLLLNVSVCFKMHFSDLAQPSLFHLAKVIRLDWICLYKSNTVQLSDYAIEIRCKIAVSFN